MKRTGLFEAFLSFCRVARQWLSVTRLFGKRSVAFSGSEWLDSGY